MSDMPNPSSICIKAFVFFAYFMQTAIPVVGDVGKKNDNDDNIQQ